MDKHTERQTHRHKKKLGSSKKSNTVGLPDTGQCWCRQRWSPKNNVSVLPTYGSCRPEGLIVASLNKPAKRKTL